MARITLKDYLAQLGEWLDAGENEEVIAHARHILESHPKHLETYRLMGKAYLEEQNFQDAGDIFQRVLSSAPDDFVAHLGMSIIREGQEDLDAAIWHMERAFESQPSNRAVQDELRRLYGEREGSTPTKVRLTRGALARMYAHGDLHNQAIGELLSALQEDADRPDLQVLLAEMYAHTDQKDEALQVCTQLLEKLPYCLYANQLLAEILIESERAQEAQVYLKRVEELDPYDAPGEDGRSRRTLPPESVMLNKLDLSGDGAEKEEATPVTPVDEDDTSFEREELPEWLSLATEDEDAALEMAEEDAAVSELADELDEELPSKTVSIEESAQEEQAPEMESVPAFESSDEDPEPAKEPEEEWDPEKETEKMGLGTEELPEWLRELQPDTGPQDVGGTPTTDLPAQAEGGEAAAADEDEDEDDDSLAWLETLAAKQGAVEDELITTPEQRSATKDLEPDDLEAEEEDDEDEMAWVDDLAEKSLAPTADLPESRISNEPQSESMEETRPAFAEDEGSEEGTPDWLKDLEDEGEASPQPARKLGTEAFNDPPDWLKELQEEAAEDRLEEPPQSEVEAAEAEGEEPEEIELDSMEWADELRDAAEEDVDEVEAAEEEEREEAEPESDNAWVPEASLDTDEAEALEEPEAAEPAPEPSPSPEPAAPAKPSKPTREQENKDRLDQGRGALKADKFHEAVEHYAFLVKRGAMTDDVIADLQAALTRHGQNVGLWQVLGDAYMRADRLREALDSYTKAEELL